MTKRILFGTSSWGLGHATRDLVLLRALLDAGCEVTVVATGAALHVIRRELAARCTYLDWPDMPSTIARSTPAFLVKTTAFVPRIVATWFAEKRRLRNLLNQTPFDAVVSDHRYGLVTDRVPSYFMTHSPRYTAPWRSWFMETCMEWFVARWLRPVNKVLIPDQAQNGLSGEMSHATRFLPEHKKVFLGHLASISPEPLPQDIDTFISISGPEPQRTRLQEIIFQQIHQLKGQVVVTLGLPEDASLAAQAMRDAPAHVQVHAYLDRAQQQAMLNRAKLVVCRSGYTTLMELAAIGRAALLIPTPGQTEQIYLADTLKQRGLYHSVRQHALDLASDVAKARSFPGYRSDETADMAAERFLTTVLGDVTTADATKPTHA